jgi:hypothetical protein
MAEAYDLRSAYGADGADGADSADASAHPLTPTQKYLLRMNDGRAFTDYSPHSAPTFPVQHHMSAQDFKQMMVHQAEDVMQKDRTVAAENAGVSSTTLNDVVDIPGFQVQQFCNTRFCTFAPAHAPDLELTEK